MTTTVLTNAELIQDSRKISAQAFHDELSIEIRKAFAELSFQEVKNAINHCFTGKSYIIEIPVSDIFEEEPDDDEYGYQVELAAILLPDNGKSFLGYELLMKVHNQQANKELGDHVFYEGTEIERGEDGIAILPIYCGS